MCGRVATPDTKDILAEFNLTFKGGEWERNINVPPTSKVPVIDSKHPNELDYKQWSLIPWYSKPDPVTGKPINKLSTFNARYDKLTESSIWKPLLGKKHCVVIVNGYYEWEELDEWADEKKKKKKKQPHFIKQRGEDFTLLAGLWEDWTNKQTGEVFTSCTVITHEAVEAWGKIHNRMPAFLTKDGSDIWLNNELPLETRLDAIKPVSEDFLESVKINQVGDVEEFEHVVFR